MPSIVPVAKAITLCDAYVGYSQGKIGLYGLFNAIRPKSGYPYDQSRFCVFTKLANGLGEVSLFVDIRYSATDQLIWTTDVRFVRFPDRTTVLQVAMMIEGCRFEKPGVYTLEMFCDNIWVCDTQIKLH